MPHRTAMPSRATFRPLLGLAVVLLAACTSVAGAGAGAGPMVADGQAFTLRPGASVMLADHGTLRYLRVANDSRCQPNVQCIRAGDAEIAMQWTPAGGAPEEFTLKTPEGGKPTPLQSHDLGDRRVTLLSLARDTPEATLRVDHAAP